MPILEQRRTGLWTLRTEKRTAFRRRKTIGSGAVLEAGVIGVPDAVYGERVVDFVALREHARHTLADYKVPERILFVAQLPKGSRERYSGVR